MKNNPRAASKPLCATHIKADRPQQHRLQAKTSFQAVAQIKAGFNEVKFKRSKNRKVGQQQQHREMDLKFASLLSPHHGEDFNQSGSVTDWAFRIDDYVPGYGETHLWV